VAINVINGYSINGYWWLFYCGYWCLLMVIDGYCIRGYWCLLMVIILMAIGGYSIVDIGVY